MAFIETVPVHDATGEVREMYARQQATWGYVPNYAKVFSHRPEVMARWASLLAGIRRNVDPRRFELVTVAAALALRNSACAVAHTRALTEFYSSDELRAIISGDGASPLSAAEHAMMAFARQIAGDAASVTAADVTALRGHGFGDAEIFDIAAVAAGRAFFAKLLDALGVEADAPFLSVDAGLRELLCIGRRIDDAAPERL